LVALARRRVPEAVAEDLAQEALAVLCSRGMELRIGTPISAERPPLAWCFQVLRNVIGNYYQRREARERWAATQPADAGAGVPTPLELLEEKEAVLRVERALRRLEAEDADCGRYLRGVVAGSDPGTVADVEGVAPAAFYRRLYRCRARLREILEREERIRT
jgi:DNA-directed RNA polymerase specialized sigma24 family protein